MLACLLWLGVLVVRADRYVVAPGTPGGTNTGEFTDWSIAATQIQWAVDKAVVDGDTVWVSNGVYVLTNQIVITNGIILRSAEGHGPEDTVINGGFAFGNPITNRCLLLSNSMALVSGLTLSNGAVLGTASTIGGGGALITSGTMSNCVVRNNRFIQLSGDSQVSGGGGINLSGGTVTVSTIHANIATNGLQYIGGGAGIHIQNAGSLVSGCVISNNMLYSTIDVAGGSGAYGCGVYMGNGARLQSSTICYNLYKIRLVAYEGFAGGVFMTDPPTTMRDCTVTMNRCGYVGGVYALGGTITNCVISYNLANQHSGALQLQVNGSAGIQCGVYNTLIIGNTNSSADSVVYISASAGMGGEARMDNCRIINNRSNSKNAIGVSITNFSLFNSEVSSNGLGISFAPGRSGRMRNCLITGNSNSASSFSGGGILIKGGSTNLSISGCTIAGNINSNLATTGAGIRFDGTNPGTVVSSCIIYSNGVSGTSDVFDACAPTNYNALQYSCVGTNTGPFTGAGIIVANPQFKDFAGGNYRLTPSSFCINRGSNEDWMNTAVDLDGRTRIRYGTVDMGAYERINQGTIYGFH